MSADARRGSLLRTVKAVAWSFVGLRSGAGYREDLGSIKPLHVIAVGIVLALLFVFGLIALVHWIA
ncbi:DUF2970 domain-containing protein [Xylophilus sp.]|uniref:DUF2970 domain-containing protein n=1 Tax=Xylophilus sp. TaxID=2653893 RepID=UPI0013B6A98F|nr:DUF2970 domain-containing protein [Xylophilus sp.]KAF1048521.1 MAG: hypothetical protein GAK38_01271 [Xylophilus sp.]